MASSHTEPWIYRAGWRGSLQFDCFPFFFFFFFFFFFSVSLQPSFVASVCSGSSSGGGSISEDRFGAHCHSKGTIILWRSRRWMWAHPDLFLQIRQTGAIFYSKRIRISRMLQGVFEQGTDLWREMRRKIYFDSRLTRWWVKCMAIFFSPPCTPRLSSGTCFWRQKTPR